MGWKPQNKNLARMMKHENSVEKFAVTLLFNT